MGPIDLFLHLFNFVAPALSVALVVTVFARFLVPNRGLALTYIAQAAINFVACTLVLLVGLVFFFLLDKAELWHHGHEHHHDQHHAHHDHDEHAHHTGHDHSHGHAHHHAGGWAILAGDSVHCFGDGILIASAFMADMRLGMIAALAVMAHEVPHHMGDLAVLRQGSNSRRAAILKVSMAGAITAFGGAIGYVLVDALHDWLPYFLVVASSSFMYVALADLIPQLQKRLSARETAAQIIWLTVGMGMVVLVSTLAGHSH